MSNQLTITEGLAELNTISKRIEKKREFISSYLVRQSRFKDPLEKQGGSSEAIQKELQAIADLEDRHLRIRLAIQKANLQTEVTVEGITKSLSEWLVWRKELANAQLQSLRSLLSKVHAERVTAVRAGATAVQAGNEASNPQDIIVNVDEGNLSKQYEQIETILGTLDGQLSLKNATVYIEV